jgi:uncharacterized protein DUF4399
MNRRLILTFFASIVFAAPAAAQTPTNSKVRLYFISPQDGETVSSPVTVRFGLSGMGVAPAGVEKDNTGHHHLLIDTDLPKMDEPIPSDAKHLHFGGGQTETSLTLPPGQHTLQLLLGNWTHVPFNPPVVSDKITITVK